MGSNIFGPSRHALILLSIVPVGDVDAGADVVADADGDHPRERAGVRRKLGLREGVVSGRRAVVRRLPSAADALVSEMWKIMFLGKCYHDMGMQA